MTTTIHNSVLKNSATWTGSAAFYADTFQLSDLPNYTNLTSVWDEYRITNVRYIFYPVTETALIDGITAGLTVSVLAPPSLITAADFTDAVVPTESVLLNHEDLVFRGPMSHLITFDVKPVVLGALFQGAFTGYGREDNQWIEANSQSVSHYGMKYGVHRGSNPSSVPFPYQIYCTYTLQFRKVVG